MIQTAAARKFKVIKRALSKRVVNLNPNMGVHDYDSLSNYILHITHKGTVPGVTR